MTLRREAAAVAALYAMICLIWGTTWLVIKIGLDGVPPFLAAGLRFALSSAALFTIIAARGVKLRMNRDGLIAVLSCGLLSFTLSYACVYWAEQYVSTGLVAIIYCTMPLVTALLSRFWTRLSTRIISTSVSVASALTSAQLSARSMTFSRARACTGCSVG